ncbi:MAG: hypothetical protein PWP23_311 [Candidatus Sumerlaeota bacterium]|nr:hypothetical protein [Candidatus Sumerlaeota bacterium]
MRFDRAKLLFAAEAVVVALAVALFYAPLLDAGRMQSGGDYANLFWPMKEFRLETLRACGALPLWNPYIFMGSPAAATMQHAVFYPLDWVFFWRSPTIPALNLYTLFHGILCGVGAWWWVRVPWRAGAAGAILAGVTYPCTAWFWGAQEHINQIGTVAWLPWLAGVAWLFAQGRLRPTRFVALYATLGVLQFLVGHPQAAFYTHTLSGVLLLGRGLACWRREGWRRPAGQLACLAAAGVLIGVLGAVQLLPALELSAQSYRQFQDVDPAYSMSFSMPPGILATYFAPNLFGTYLDGFVDQRAYNEYGLFVGYGVLVFAVCGAVLLVREGRWRRSVFLCGVLLFTILMAMGGNVSLRRLATGDFTEFPAPASRAASVMQDVRADELGTEQPRASLLDYSLHEIYIALVPPARGFRVPARTLVVTALLWVTLAGLGLDRVVALLDARFSLKPTVQSSLRDSGSSGCGFPSTEVLGYDQSSLRDSSARAESASVGAQASSARAVDSSARAQASSAKAVDSSARAQASSARAVDSSERAQASSARAVDSSERAEASSARAVDSSERAEASSAKAVDSSARAEGREAFRVLRTSWVTYAFATAAIALSWASLYSASAPQKFRFPKDTAPLLLEWDTDRALRESATLDGRLFRLTISDLDHTVSERERPAELRLEEANGGNGIWQRWMRLMENNNAVIQFPSIEGYEEGLAPTVRTKDFLFAFNRHLRQFRPDPQFLALLGIGRIFSDLPLDESTYPLVPNESRSIRRMHATPSSAAAFWAAQAAGIDFAALEGPYWLGGETLGRRQDALRAYGHAPAWNDAWPPLATDVTNPNRVVITAADSVPGDAVLAMAYAPGWTIDGQEAEWLGAVHVLVPAQAFHDGRAELRYEPRSYRVGLYLTAAGLMLLGLLWRWPHESDETT